MSPFPMQPPMPAAPPRTPAMIRQDERKQLAALRRAAAAIYLSGRWELSSEQADELNLSPQDRNKLWENLRDALGFKPGTNTAVSMPVKDAKDTAIADLIAEACPLETLENEGGPPLDRDYIEEFGCDANLTATDKLMRHEGLALSVGYSMMEDDDQ